MAKEVSILVSTKNNDNKTVESKHKSKKQSKRHKKDKKDGRKLSKKRSENPPKKVKTKEVKREDPSDILGNKVRMTAANFLRRFFNEKKFLDQTLSSSTQQDAPKELEDREKMAFYDNVDDNVQSPEANSPQMMAGDEFTSHLYNKSVPRYKIEKEFKDLAFLSLAILNISSAIMFPIVMMRNGGFTFFIQFIICTVFIVIPINLSQSFLAQFTSLPPFFIYYRMAPITVGVGILTTVAQYLVSSTVKFDHRFMSMALEVIYGLSASRISRNRGSKVYGLLEGFDPNYCLDKEMFVRGYCHSTDDLLMKMSDSERGYTQASVHKLLQSDPILRSMVAPKIDAERIFDPRYMGAHYVSGILIPLVASFFISLKGISFYAKHLRNLVFFGTIFSCLIMIAGIVLKWKDMTMLFIRVIGMDLSYLFSGNAWGHALAQAFSIFSSTDGTFYGMGFISEFKDNFVKDVLYQTAFGFCLVVVFAFSFGLAMINGVSLDRYDYEKRDLTPSEIRDHLFNDDDAFKYLFKFFFQNSSLPFFLIVFAFFFTLWQVCSQVILAQLTVTTIYRMFRTLVRLPNFIVSYVILFVHFTSIFFMHTCISKEYSLAVQFFAPLVMIIQLAAIALFSFKSLFPCCYAIFKTHRYQLRKYRFYITVFYQFFLPIVLLVSFLRGFWEDGFGVLQMVLFPVIGFGVMNLSYYSFKSNWKVAFMPMSSWGPADIGDKLQYLKQERAASN